MGCLGLVFVAIVLAGIFSGDNKPGTTNPVPSPEPEASPEDRIPAWTPPPRVEPQQPANAAVRDSPPEDHSIPDLPDGYTQHERPGYVLELPVDWYVRYVDQYYMFAYSPESNPFVPNLQERTSNVRVQAFFVKNAAQHSFTGNLEQDTAQYNQLPQNCYPKNQQLAPAGPHKIAIGGNRTMVTLFESVPSRVTCASLTVVRPEGLFVLFFLANDAEWQRTDSVFERIQRSVRFR